MKILNVVLAAVLVMGLGLGATVRMSAEDNVINVPGDFNTIQAAIDAASDGDTVVVAAGLYKENIVIDKSLILKGAQAGVDARNRSGDETIVEPSDGRGIEIVSAAHRVVVIDGFTVRNARSGITSPHPARKDDINDITVRNVRVLNSSKVGIAMWYTSRATVEYCYVEGGEYGVNGGDVEPLGPTVATFRNNEIVNAEFGITGYLKDSLIEGNLVRDSDNGGAAIAGQFLDTQVKNNTVTGYSKGAGMTFEEHYSRKLAENVTVEGNTFTGNRHGIYVFPNQIELVGIAVNFNKIFGNSSFGVRNDGPVTLDATKNWWGHADGPGGVGPGDRDRVSAKVLYAPWLGAEPGTTPMTWGVDPTGSIQHAVDLATSGDTIVVTEGEYREDLGIGKSLTIGSANGAEATAIIGSVSVDLTDEIVVLGGDGVGFTVQADGRDYALRLCLEDGSQVTVRENILAGATAGVDTCPDGLGDNSTVAIVYNRIRQNNEYGIHLAPIGAGSTVVVNYNDIAENGNNGLYVEDSAVIIDATSNWWGHESGPYHSADNVGGEGNSVTGNVTFQPWLNAPLCTLKISSAGGGVVTVPGERAFIYAPGVEVDLEATPNSGYEFDRWIGDIDTIINVRAPATTIIMNDDCSIVARFKSLPCFIAAAAYGTDTADELDVLRDFRDSALLPNSLGAWFVGLYYRTSPPVAGYISRYEALRTAVRVGFIGPMVVVLTLTQRLWSLAA